MANDLRKVKICTNQELFPCSLFYLAEEDDDDCPEIDTKTLKRWQSAKKRWEACQEEMERVQKQFKASKANVDPSFSPDYSAAYTADQMKAREFHLKLLTEKLNRKLSNG